MSQQGSSQHQAAASNAPRSSIRPSARGQDASEDDLSVKMNKSIFAAADPTEKGKKTIRPLISAFQEVKEEEEEQDVPVRVDIISQNNLMLYQFLGYVLDSSGEFDKIYDEMCAETRAINAKKQQEYKKKLQEMKETGDYKTKLEMPPDEDFPPKKYEKMFEQYLEINEMSLTDKFMIKLKGKKFILQYRLFDKVSHERIKNLPDGVIFLVEGKEEDFKVQFTEQNEMKQAFFMHLFFGTPHIFFLPYFNYRDRLMRHLDYQNPEMEKVKAYMDGLFQFVSKISS